MIEIDLDNIPKLTKEEKEEADKCVEFLKQSGVDHIIKDHLVFLINDPKIFIYTLLLTLNKSKTITINHKNNDKKR